MVRTLFILLLSLSCAAIAVVPVDRGCISAHALSVKEPDAVAKKSVRAGRLARTIGRAVKAVTVRHAVKAAVPVKAVVPEKDPVPVKDPVLIKAAVPVKDPIPLKAVKLKTEKPTKANAVSVVMPLEVISVMQKFGPRIHPVLKCQSFHNGVDYGAELNDKVLAICDGVVVFAGDHGDLGNAVFIKHPALQVTSIYGHLNYVALRKGQMVRAGDVIGYAGTTGRSTGVHLHLTIKDSRHRRYLEPETFLAKVGARLQGYATPFYTALSASSPIASIPIPGPSTNKS